jgi:hypothetical protein
VVGLWSRRRLRREEGHEVGAEEEDGEAEEHELDAVHGDCARPYAPLPSWGRRGDPAQGEGDSTRRRIDDRRRKRGINFSPTGPCERGQRPSGLA